MITTSCGIYKRAAWTGGDTPPPEFAKTRAGRELVQWFIDDQVADCGGMENLPQWCFGRVSEHTSNLKRALRRLFERQSGFAEWLASVEERAGGFRDSRAVEDLLKIMAKKG